MPASDDAELLCLVNVFDLACRGDKALPAAEWVAALDAWGAARAALLAYIDAHYLRLPPAIDGEPAEVEEAAGDEYTGRRERLPLTDARATYTMRVGFAAGMNEVAVSPKSTGRERTLSLDDAGQVVSGAPDFEGER